MFQETWLDGNESLKANGYTLICNGLQPAEQSRRGSQGVAIALSRRAMQSWTQSGMQIARVLARVISIRMIVLDNKNKEIGL
eukprot:10368580-Ditylum_brightwellii.AAC.1